jgi:hypothetical protein
MSTGRLLEKIINSSLETPSVVGERFRKTFENLAKSRDEFKNVGRLNTQCTQSSGVYIAPRIVATADHALPSGFKSNTYLFPNVDNMYFSIEDQHGKTQKARVILATRHPNFQADVPNKTLSIPTEDIALLLLDREFKNMPPIQMNFVTPKNEENGIGIGYTREYITPLYKDKRLPVFESNHPVKIATKFPSLSYAPKLGLHICTLGHPSSINSAGDLTFKNINLSDPQKDPLEIGVYHGMSGGGYFNHAGLLGIMVCTYKINIQKTPSPYSSQFLDSIFCVPFSYHKAWLMETMNLYKKQLPALDKQELSNKYNIDKLENQKEEINSASKNQMEQILQLKLDNLRLFLTHFYMEHLERNDHILNDAISEYLLGASSLSDISHIKEELLKKGYSLNSTTFFNKNSTIISDIQKIISITNDILATNDSCRLSGFPLRAKI